MIIVSLLGGWRCGDDNFVKWLATAALSTCKFDLPGSFPAAVLFSYVQIVTGSTQHWCQMQTLAIEHVAVVVVVLSCIFVFVLRFLSLQSSQ